VPKTETLTIYYQITWGWLELLTGLSGYSNALAPNVRYDSCCSLGYLKMSMSFGEMFVEQGNPLPSSASKCLLLLLLFTAVNALRKI